MKVYGDIFKEGDQWVVDVGYGELVAGVHAHSLFIHSIESHEKALELLREECARRDLTIGLVCVDDGTT